MDGVAGRDGDGIHVVAYFGDTTGEGRYSSGDAQRIARLVQQLDTGYPAWPLADPALVGDIDRDGRVSSADSVALVKEVQYLTGGRRNPALDQPQIPLVPEVALTAEVEEGGVVFAAAAPAVGGASVAAAAVSAGARTAAPGGFELSRALGELNALRTSTPAQDLSLRFLRGERTWDQAAAIGSAEESWRVKLPKLTAGVKLAPGAVPEGASAGVAEALRYLVKRKGGGR